MLVRLAADLIVALHLLFVVFVIAGGFLVWRWRKLAWAHVPAAIWGALIEFEGWICPLTPLENALRQRAGSAGYAGGFVEHYIIPVVYPAGLTPTVQIVLGVSVIAVNVIAYGVVIARWRLAGSR
jgi:hypothetical protein